jgi:hypothetical protein
MSSSNLIVFRGKQFTIPVSGLGYYLLESFFQSIQEKKL